MAKKITPPRTIQLVVEDAYRRVKDADEKVSTRTRGLEIAKLEREVAKARHSMLIAQAHELGVEVTPSMGGK